MMKAKNAKTNDAKFKMIAETKNHELKSSLSDYHGIVS